LGEEAIEAFRQHLHTAQRLHYPSGNYSHLFKGAALCRVSGCDGATDGACIDPHRLL
jgi:hypothetical protein